MSCFLEGNDVASFLNLILTSWTVSNGNIKYDPNPLGSAIARNNNKMNFFFEKFADTLETWTGCPKFCLSKKKMPRPLVLTL